LKETLIENTGLPGQIAVVAMAHSRRRTGEGVEAARREMAGRERGREREREKERERDE